MFLILKSTAGAFAGGGIDMMIHMYERIISLENLLAAWTEFIKGKRKRKDVAIFADQLPDNRKVGTYPLSYFRQMDP